MAHILITGGAGFIGSHVARELLQRGDRVTLLDDFNNRYDPALKEARIQHMFKGGPIPKLVRGDVRDQALLDKLFASEQFDDVVHLAAWASVQPSIENPHIYADVNVNGTIRILEVSRKHNIRHVVAASSSSVYGGIQIVPFREDMDISRPISPYAATKAATETMCATWHNMYDISTTCLRFFTVYGPWGRPEMAMFKFTNAMLAGKPIHMRGRTTMRDFTYIDDIVQGIVRALDNPDGFSIYNLGESDAVPLPRLIAALERALNIAAKVREVPLPPGDIPATLADISRAQQAFGYQPTTSIEEGVTKFVEWYMNWYVPVFESSPVPQHSQ